MAVPVTETHSLHTRRPFSRAEARRAGIGLGELLNHRFHKVFYDCYIASTVPITTELRAEAALGISRLARMRATSRQHFRPNAGERSALTGVTRNARLPRAW
jgi:hypothetical protein